MVESPKDPMILVLVVVAAVDNAFVGKIVNVGTRMFWSVITQRRTDLVSSVNCQVSSVS